MRSRAALVFAMLCVSACNDNPGQLPTGEAPAIQPSAEIDIGGLARRMQLGFHPGGADLVAASPILHATARPDGALLLEASDGEHEGTIQLRTLGESSAYRVGSDGAVERPVAQLTERIEMNEGEVEQSWRVPARPTGDLIVRVGVTGARYLGDTESGLHFRGTGAIGFRYSHATFVDAAGTRTALPARWVEEGIELRVPEEVLAGAAFPAVLDPTVGPEFDVDDPVRVPHVSSQFPDVVFDGAQFWVGWQDFGRPFNTIRLARVAIDGTVLDPDGIVVEQQGGFSPSLAVAGDRLFVGWSQDVGGSYRVYAKRVLLDGTVMDAGPITVAASSSAENVRVASDGIDALVTYSNRAVRVSRDGLVLDPTPITTPNYVQGLAFSNGRYVMVHAFSANIAAWRIGTDGVLQDLTPVLIPVATEASRPQIAASGSGLAMAWFEGVRVGTGGGWTHTGVGACRFDDDGMLGTSTPVSFAAPIAAREDLWVSSHGARTWVAWAEGRAGETEYEVYGVRLSPTGALLDPSPITIAASFGSQRGPAIAAGPGGSLVVWGNQPPSSRFLHGRRIADDGAWIDVEPFPIATSSNNQRRPVSAYGAGMHLVVWNDFRFFDTAGDVYGVRIRNDGIILDATPLVIAGADETELPTDVVFDGTHFLVLYTHVDPVLGQEVYARRVAPDGTFPDPEPFVIASAAEHQQGARGASDGSQHLIVWLDRRGLTTDQYQVWAQRFALDGSPLADPEILHEPYRGRSVAVAYTAGIFVVGWHHRIMFSTALANWGVRIRPDGSRIDATPFGLPGQESLVLVSGPDSVLALGARNRAGGGVDFYADWVSPTRLPAAPSPYAYAVSTGSGRWLAASWTGSQYLAFGYNANTTMARLSGVPLSSRAVVDPTGEFEVMPVQGSVLNGTASSAQDGRALYAYSRIVPEAPYGSDRVRARWIGDGLAANGTACTDPAGCGSGYCVDGVCCDSACGASEPSDCQACSVLAGATMDGTCSALAPGTVCRSSRGLCDAEETCDGAAVVCPANARRGPDVICRGSRGGCDVEERCDGLTDACSGDTVRSADYVCRPAAGDCDIEELCDGASELCPEDARRSVDHVCRPAAAQCDLEERCDGVAEVCPANGLAADGTACGDGLLCNGVETCEAGVCAGGTLLDCDDGDVCTADSCEEPSGCAHVEIAGCRDAGVDAGTDAGTDAGVDAGTDAGRDAGTDAGVEPPHGGCGCRTGSGAPAPAWVLVIAVAAIAQRRRSLRG